MFSFLCQYPIDYGDYSTGVPPLTIPNREVKSSSADGTALICGRVCRRQLLLALTKNQGFFYFFFL